MGKREFLLIYGTISCFTLFAIFYFINAFRRNPLNFNFLWIWIFLIVDAALVILGTYVLLNVDKFKSNPIIQKIQTSLGRFSNYFFNIETKMSKIISLMLILCLFYGIGFLFVLIHEFSHAFAALLVGGYTKYIEVDYTLYGLAHIRGIFSNPESVLISLAGILGELILGILVISFLLTLFKKNKFSYFLSIIILIDGLIYSLFTYSIIFMFPMINDFFYISQILHVQPFVICLFFLPHLIISIYIGKKLVLFFYKTHLNSKIEFLYVVLISLIIFTGIYYGIFPLIHQGYAFTLY